VGHLAWRVLVVLRNLFCYYAGMSVVLKVERPTTASLVADLSNPVRVRTCTGPQDNYTPHLAFQRNLPLNTGRCFRQFDRKTDCYRKGSGKWDQGSQQHAATNIAALTPLAVPFTVMVCGTQTKQGGCLYEQPGVRYDRYS
jgi:hypothetical protein